MAEFVKQKFPNSTILKSVDDGINETYYFSSKKQSSGSKKYVGKKFSDNSIDTNDYLAAIEVSQSYVEDGDYLNVPVICHFGVFDGDAYVIYEYIEGTPLDFTSIYDNGEIDYYLDIVGKMTAELHNQESPVDKFGWFTSNSGSVELKHGYSDSLEHSLSQTNYCFEEIDNSVLDSEDRDTIRNMFRKYIDRDSNPSICHCDVGYGNLVHSDNGIHLIDWEFIRSADALYDLVKTERKLIGGFSQNKELTDDEYERYRNTLHNAYFEVSDMGFDKNRYTCQKIRDMVSGLKNCKDWYSEDSLAEVQSYYSKRIEECITELQ